MDGSDKGLETFADPRLSRKYQQEQAVKLVQHPRLARLLAKLTFFHTILLHTIKSVISPSDSHTALSLVRSTLAANQSYQKSLDSLAQSLRSELARSEKLLGEVERNATSKGIGSVLRTWPKEHVVLIREGWVGMKTIIGRKQIFADDSPFHDDVIRHKRYRNLTTPNHLLPKERSSLMSTVRNENMRLCTRELASSGATDALDNCQLPILNERTMGWIGTELPLRFVHSWASPALNPAELLFEQRTAQECKVQWMVVDRPESANATDLSWDDEEDVKLRSLVGDKDYKQGEVDWVVVATELGGNRLPIHCPSRFLCLEGLALPQPKKGNTSSQRPGAGLPREKEQWTTKEDAELLDAVYDLGAGKWRAISQSLSTLRTPPACAQRYRASLDPTIKKGEWTYSEDEKLREAVTVYGTHWSKVSSCVKGRTGPQCRERYTRTTIAGINGGRWTSEEDRRLRQAVVEGGIKDWNVVADVVGTRSGQQCQRRWGILEKLPNISVPDNSNDPRDGDGDSNAKDDVGPNTPDPASDTTTSAKTRSTKRGRRQRKPPAASNSPSTSANAMDGVQEVTSARSDHEGAEQGAEEAPRPVTPRPKPKPRTRENISQDATNVEV
ncbi:uncharacterized protein EI90DRAFT_3133247 [Cantharellus anzutake]|uniref:uncharacterized protein n=1 Tax=Cantharellus anzutake TaxID=1750568 RepID=UPI00190394C1|nr:uncharacterized protein EI90DRAFT_3133247 [Cantharellus anzutake]KAF8318284.1 hypothetical protein EI90DRAFT_3133247 [Cantharellus anzutake]